MQVHPGLGAAAMAMKVEAVGSHDTRASATAGPASAGIQLSHQQWEFLSKWRDVVHPKLAQLLSLLGSQDVARNLGLVQVWTYLPVLTEGRQLLKADALCLLGEPRLGPFHRGCVEQGAPVHLLGPMGRAWEGGVVKVVQSLENLSRDTHPCNRLQGDLERLVSEAVYIPIFDRGPCSGAGVVAVLELLVSSQALDYMVVADAISCVAQLLDALQLSLSNPLLHPRYPSDPQPSCQPTVAAAGGPVPTAAVAALGKLSLEQHGQQGQRVGEAPSKLGPLTAAQHLMQQQVPEGAPFGSLLSTADSGSGAPTAPSSPHTGVPTPLGSPAAASPFALKGAGSPLGSPSRPSAAAAAGSPYRRPPLSAGELQLPPSPAALPATRRGSAPPAFALPPAPRSAFAAAAGAGAPREPPAWPGAGWVHPSTAPRATSLDLPPAPQGAQQLERAGSSSSTGGMGRRSLSRTASFRRGLNESSLVLADMSDD